MGGNNSTVITFVVFGAIVAVAEVILLLIYFGNNSMLGRHDGLVQNSIVTLFGAFFVALFLDFRIRIRQEQTANRIAKIALSEMSIQINGVLRLFAAAIRASSDGFQPITMKGMFGRKAAELFSLNLDLNKSAGTASNAPWSQRIDSEVKAFKIGLTSISARYLPFLPEEAVLSVARLHNHRLFGALNNLDYMMQLSERIGTKRDVLNIPIDTLENLLQDIYSEISTITKYSTKLGSDVTPIFPASDFSGAVLPTAGSARFEGDPGPPFEIRG